MLCATICPAVSLHLAQDDNTSGFKLSQAFCGWGGMSFGRHLATFLVVWIASDFYEFAYHRLGKRVSNKTCVFDLPLLYERNMRL